VGGHVFGKIYTGGIGTILTAWFDALKASDEIQSLCIQCGNCTEVCPGKIDIPGLILELRRRSPSKKGNRWRRRRSSLWSTTAGSSILCCARPRDAEAVCRKATSFAICRFSSRI
jgi:L-lactate utilization protein LutB